MIHTIRVSTAASAAAIMTRTSGILTANMNYGEMKTMKMKNENKTTVNGIGFSGLLTIALIVLKLIGKISWSWIWVFSPIWISTLFFILFIVFLILVKAR